MSWGIGVRIRQYVKSSLWLAPLVAGLDWVALATVRARRTGGSP